MYSVVLDTNRNLACSGSMDGTVRVWNLSTGQCQHTLTGHSSLVGLLGLSPSYLVSAAADSTLRVWDPDTGELRHTLAAHSGAITCFQHDEFKVLSGSDGTLKMWDIRDGSQVRDLLTSIVGVWQVVFEGRWCVAASNRMDCTVLDVCDFGYGDGGDDEWIGEPPGGQYDEDTDDEDDLDQPEVDAMDQVLEGVPSGPEDVDVEDHDLEVDDEDEDRLVRWDHRRTSAEESVSSRSAPYSSDRASRGKEGGSSSGAEPGPSGSPPHVRALPSTDETPTRPRTRYIGSRRR